MSKAGAVLIPVMILLLISCGQIKSPPSIPTGTSIFELTGEPTSEPPTQTSNPTSTVTTVPAGPCDNPLTPLNIGNQWKYQATSLIGGTQQSLRVTDWIQEAGLHAVIEMENLGTQVVDIDPVTCLENGAIEDFPLFFVSMLMGDYLDGVFNTYYVSGIYSPGYNEIASKDWSLGWQAKYLTEQSVCLNNPMGSDSLCIIDSSRVMLEFISNDESESITVPAGTFPNARKVEFELTLPATITFPDFVTSAPLTLRIIQWYEPFIGLVRARVESATLDLIPGQESNLSLDSLIELLEYNVIH